MNQTRKILLGVLTFLPFLLGLLAFNDLIDSIGPMIENASENNLSEDELGGEFFQMLSGIMIYTMVISLLVFALMIYYIVDTFRTPHLEDKKDLKILWTILHILFAIPAMQVYYFLYVVRDPETTEDRKDKEDIAGTSVRQ